MSTGGVGGRVRNWLAVSDARLLIVFGLALYALFLLVSPLQGYDLNGTVNFLRRITFLAALYGILVLALNVQWGYAGLFNIGVAGFMAVGVYTMGILSSAPTSTGAGLGLPLPIGIVGGILAATLVGVIVSLPALRLRGDYLAIVTLAAAEIIRLAIRSPVFQEVSVGGLTIGTGGPQGMQLPSNPLNVLFYEDPAAFNSDPNALGAFLFDFFEGLGIQETVVVGWAYAIMLVVVLALVYVLLVRVGSSPFGRVLKAIREDRLVASSLGKDTRWFKIKVFAIGCALMGLAAILWRLSGGYTSSNSYLPIQTFFVFIALIIGGAGSNTGSVIGGAVFAALLFEGPFVVRRLVQNLFEIGTVPRTSFDAFGSLLGLDPGPLLAYIVTDVNISALRLVILGVVLIFLIQNRPEGLLGHRKEVAATVDLGDRSAGGER
jgi:branched-chain amino acid transport system permease protein